MKKNILIIDDEEALLESMKDMLELKGYTIHAALNGVNGLRICSENNIDLIILDLNMPRMDGYLFMEHLMERWELDNRAFKLPKILVLTAVDKGTDMGLAKNKGASMIMHKPFKSTELADAVKTLLK